jgi:hypothetical protein
MWYINATLKLHILISQVTLKDKLSLQFLDIIIYENENFLKRKNKANQRWIEWTEVKTKKKNLYSIFSYFFFLEYIFGYF